MRSAFGPPLLFVFFITATTNHVITTLNALSLSPLAAVQHIVGRSTVAKNFVTQSYSFVSLSATSSSTDGEDDSDSNNDTDKDNERSNKKNRKKKDESKHKSHDDVKKKHQKEEVKSDQDDMNDNSDEKMKQVLEVAAAYTNSDELPTLPKQQQDDSAYNVVQKELMFIQSLGAITSRGEHASKEQRLAAQQIVSELEEIQSSNDKHRGSRDDEAAPSLLGRWELVFCDCGQLFRSSPFFMAGRAVCQTEQQAAQYDWFCDMHRKALAISNIGPVRQIITPTRLVSEFEVVVGAIPFLNDIVPFLSYSGGMPVTITGAIVSTADWTKPTTHTETTSSSNNDMELYMDTVEIKGSNMPLLRQVLDTGNVRLKSRDLANALEQAVPSMYTTPRPMFRTTYLDELFRVGRDQDDNIFVYVKTSESTDLTDYSTIDADLGVARLLEGFNDAVTRLYL
jgi:hypothetical protein